MTVRSTRVTAIIAVTGALLAAIALWISPRTAQGTSRTSKGAGSLVPTLARAQAGTPGCKVRAAQEPPLGFKNNKKADRWLGNFFRKGNIYPKGERKALDAYSLSSELINSFLRGIPLPSSVSVKKLEGQVSSIDSATHRGSLCRGVIVWRGFGPGILPNTGFKKYVHRFINDPAFLSTSLLKRTARNFALGVPKKKSAFLAEIYLPSALSVASPTTVSSVFKGVSSEQEVLLPRDTDFQVVTIKKIKLAKRSVNFVVLAAINRNFSCYCVTGDNKQGVVPSKTIALR